MKPEQAFYHKIKEKLKECHVCRIENSTMSGMPDLYVRHGRHQCWVELKVFVGGRVLLRKEQWAWGHREANHGGLVYVLALNCDVVYLWMYCPLHIMKVQQHGKYLAIAEDPVSQILLKDFSHNFLVY